jgi:hypothetical protein
MSAASKVRSPPDKRRATQGNPGGPRKSVPARTTNDGTTASDALPWRVLIKDRIGREIVWNRYCTRAGALAEVRALHGRGVAHARVEGPPT